MTYLVTELAPVGKTRTRVCINEEQTLVLSNREITEYGLRLEEEIPETIWQELEKVMYQRAIRKCGDLLKGMSYTEKGLREKLLQSGVTEKIADRAVEAMRDAHYVDDRSYAESYLRGHLARKSKRRVEQELLQKGMAEEVAAEAFAAWEAENAGGTEELEQQQIRAFIDKKKIDPEQLEWSERQKIMASLMRKGYSCDAVRRVLQP